MSWSIVLPILQLILASVTPTLKAAALAELKALEVAEKDAPLLLLLIAEAEKIVAAV